MQAISGVLSTNNTLPILDNFLFDLKKDSLLVSASDLETTMTVEIPVTKAEKTGSIAIPAKILLNTLKTFSDIPLTFSVNTETCGIELSAGEGKYKMTGSKADEFPKIPTLDNTASVELNSPMLATAINKTVFATGNDDLRPVMSGVFCTLSSDNVTFVATDAHKLVCYKRNDAKSKNAASFILPKKPLNQLKSILSHEDKMVKIEYNNTYASFAFDNINLI